MTFEEGALLEPLSVAIHAGRRAGLKPGGSCTVFGAGAVGLMCAVAARLEGCARVAIVDVAESRVKFAIDNGFAQAGFVAPAQRYSDPQEQLKAAEEISYKLGAVQFPGGLSVDRSDCVFECTGVEICTQASVFVSGLLVLHARIRL